MEIFIGTKQINLQSVTSSDYKNHKTVKFLALFPIQQYPWHSNIIADKFITVECVQQSPQTVKYTNLAPLHVHKIHQTK